MFFFTRKSKTEVIGFIGEKNLTAAEFAPVKLSKEIIPSWWKNVKSSSFDWERMLPLSTSKSCIGIINSITSGIILPLWSDLAIKYNNDGIQFRYADTVSELQPHDSAQIQGFYTDFWVTKIVSPWYFKSQCKLHFTSPFYSHTSETPYVVAPGIVTPVNNYSASHVFLFLRKNKEEQRIFIKNNTPLVQIIPLTDKDITFKTEVISDVEMQKINSKLGTRLAFNNKGLKTIQILDKD